MIGLNMFLANMASIVCVGVAAFMGYHDKQGWGWFLVVAVILYVGITQKNSKAE